MAGNTDRATLTSDDEVAVIRLCRIDQLNAFDVSMHRAIDNLLDEVEGRADVKALVLTGEGRAFSAGQDLWERASVFAAGQAPDLRASLDQLYNPLVRRLATLPIPVIAAVNGVAFGAGAGIAIACDLTIAAESARFVFGFVNVGLGPDCGVSWTLQRLVGPQRAADLLLSGRPVDGREAERIGLVARCVEDARLLPEALELARQLAGKSGAALRAIKHQLAAASDTSLTQALDAERDAQEILGQSPAYRAAVLRFSARPRT
jgi:2-(1,2-epoxy-1,2-dihydrophenyl)acetyl-CoA isomerase